MSLINVNNSNHIEGDVVSLRLHSQHGDRFLDTCDEIREAIWDLADGRADFSYIREAAGTLSAYLGSGGRTLYRLQAMLNDEMWKVIGVEVEVEYRMTRDHVQPLVYPGLTLLVKSPWNV